MGTFIIAALVIILISIFLWVAVYGFVAALFVFVAMGQIICFVLRHLILLIIWLSPKEAGQIDIAESLAERSVRKMSHFTKEQIEVMSGGAVIVYTALLVIAVIFTELSLSWVIVIWFVVTLAVGLLMDKCLKSLEKL